MGGPRDHLSSNASLFDVFCTPFNTFGLTAKDKEPGESAGTPLPLLPKAFSWETPALTTCGEGRFEEW